MHYSRKASNNKGLRIHSGHIEFSFSSLLQPKDYKCSLFCVNLNKSKTQVMSIKGTQTKADYINFDTATRKGKELLKEEKTELIGLYILVSINTGLRTGDVLKLTWEQLRGDMLNIYEGKTKKPRTIALNDEIKNAVNKVDRGNSGLVFISQKNTVYSRQQINRKLKDVFSVEAKKHNISTHSLRKSFGRRVYENHHESEKALVYLNELFNHTSIAITRRYLGIRQEELNDIYRNL